MKLERNHVSTDNCDVLLIGYEEWENLGLRYIASYLKEHGVKAQIESCDRASRENILAAIRKQNPIIVGFSLIFQRMLHEFADLISFLRQNGIAAHFTMGGHFPSIEYRKTLESIPGLDSVVRGEGEETSMELYQQIARSNSLSHINGLAYRINGEIVTTPPRSLIRKLDDLPFPIRSDKVVTQRGMGLRSILSSRGCPYDCSFCSIRLFYQELPGPKRRSRSPSNVASEIDELFHEQNTRIFIFEDDDFAMKAHRQKQWIEEFVDELKKKKIADKILWRISCRVDEIDKELIRKMMEVGLMSVYTGIESGNDHGLMIYNKRYTVEDIYRAIDILYDLKMPFEFGFMILNPDSTFETIKADVDFLKVIGSTGCAVVHFTKMVPYAGTPIANKLEKEGRLKGTIAAPDYDYKDPRLELLQLFFTQAFHFRNFDNNGLVERLRHAKFDGIVLNKFFATEYDTDSYKATIQSLTRASNDTCLENMSMAVNLMKERAACEILDNWHFLDRLAMQENETDQYITSALDYLMHYPPSKTI
ncbi:MAG: B12-binding domain-containing radical SAM protein [Phycisphaerae bacterium]|nr:B12-binding domain-containing radical SAM protein [Phycisphaerae bacterium]